MTFCIKLKNKSDDKKLKGITLFEDLGRPLELGTGKKEYHYFLESEYFHYIQEIYDIMEEIGEIVPNARICYQSDQHATAGGIDSMLKLENENKIYVAYEWGIEYSSSWDGEYDDEQEWDIIGTDAWCNLVVEISQLD
jgi:hypothetical protein